MALRNCRAHRISRLLLTTVLVAWGSFAAGQTSGFVRTPTPANIMAVYPSDALEAGWGGYAVLTCEHDPAGLLTHCQSLGSEQKFKGFAGAGLKLVTMFQLDMADAKKAPNKVQLAIAFLPPGAPPPLRQPAYQSYRGQWSNLAPIGPYWPEAAQRNQIPGQAVIDCHVEASGHLTGCKFIAEDPAGWSFGDAALRMAAAGFMTAGAPTSGETPPADGVWRFIVEFREPKSWR